MDYYWGKEMPINNLKGTNRKISAVTDNEKGFIQVKETIQASHQQ
jgi:hypothetical protein